MNVSQFRIWGWGTDGNGGAQKGKKLVSSSEKPVSVSQNWPFIGSTNLYRAAALH